MSSQKLSIGFGLLEQNIRAQLRDQGFTSPVSLTARWQRMADAVTLLKVQRILTQTEASKAHSKIVQAIACHVRTKSNPAAKKGKP